MICFLGLAGGCHAAILGPDRALAVAGHLPQISSAPVTIGITQMDQMGGTDGMDHARGEPKQKGGLLNFYLLNNVEEQDRRLERASAGPVHAS